MRGEFAPTESSRILLRFAIGATAATTALKAVTKIGTLSTLASRVTAATPTSGFAWLSRTIGLSLRPFAPPAALISSTAHM
jgi:hypothetical protein